MLRTVRALQQLGLVPLRKLVLNLECADDQADEVKDQIHAALSFRPVGIEAQLKTTCEERVARETAARTTPMDTIEGFAQRHGARVEFRADSDMPVSSDAPPPVGIR